MRDAIILIFANKQDLPDGKFNNVKCCQIQMWKFKMYIILSKHVLIVGLHTDFQYYCGINNHSLWNLLLIKNEEQILFCYSEPYFSKTSYTCSNIAFLI